MPRKGHSTSSVETTTTPSFPLEDVTSEHGARGEPYSRYTAEDVAFPCRKTYCPHLKRDRTEFFQLKWC
jgi:hypothetical protein